MSNLKKVIFLLLVLFLSCFNGAQAAQKISVYCRKAVKKNFPTELNYMGTLDPIQTVHVTPEITARIDKVHFKEGAYVKAGSVLFSLESAQYQATVSLRKAELSKNNSNLDRAQKYLKRLQTADKRSIPAADIDAADCDVKQAQASIAESKANLQLAQIDVNRTKITAPITGRIGKAQQTKGNSVIAGTFLAAIMQIKPIRVKLQISDKDFFKFDIKNFKAKIKLPDGKFYDEEGEFDFSNNTFDPTTGTMTAWWRLKNDDDKLIPGVTVNVTLTLHDNQDRVFIPQSAKLTDSQGNYVYVIKDDKAFLRRVTTGIEAGQEIQVTGIEEGEFVVTEGTLYLFDGAEVNAKVQGL